MTCNQIQRFIKVTGLDIPPDYLNTKVPDYDLPDLDENDGARNFNPKLMLKYGLKKSK